MATTALFVEILVIGTLANIWVSLILFAGSSSNLITPALIDSVSKLSVFLILPVIAITYVLGWVVHFLGERLLEPAFQTKFKDHFFKSSKVDYDEVRATFYQKASESVIEDINFDRQVLRISRSSVINFAMISFTLLFYLNENTTLIILSVFLSICITLFSFLQWKNQYERSYRKMLDTYLALVKK